MGIKIFAVTSNDERIENPKCLLKSEKKLIAKQKHLSRKKRGDKE